MVTFLSLISFSIFFLLGGEFAKRNIFPYGLGLRTLLPDFFKIASKNEPINLGGKTSLQELAALIREAKFFLGLDSIASHLAAAVGAYGVSLFGPSNSFNWRPWSEKISIISRDGSEEFCQKHGHLRGKYKNCLCYISPERVIQEIDKIIS